MANQLSDYDAMRAEATALPLRKVAFDLIIPMEWWRWNDNDDFENLMELYIENKWGPRGASPKVQFEWQTGYYDNCYDGVFLHEFMQYHCGPHDDEYTNTKIFVVKVRVYAEIHRFVFGYSDGTDSIDREGL